MPNLWRYLRENFGIGQWSFIGPGSEKKWYSSENSPQGAWDNIAEKMLLEFEESGHLVFRATTPLSRGTLKSKGRGKLSIHFAADQDTIDTILSHFSFCHSAQFLRQQWQLYAKKRTIKIDRENLRFWWVNQLFSVKIKAEVPLQNENPMNDQIIWQQYIQRIESLSPENRVSNFCKEAGFMRVVEVGQYFVTKDTGDFRQFHSVACREYTLPQETIQLHKQTDGFKETWELGLYWKSRPVFKTSNMELKFRNWVRESRQFSFLSQNFLWNGQIRDRFYSGQHGNSCRSTRRASSTNKHECGCSQVKGKSKTSTESTRWDE